MRTGMSIGIIIVLILGLFLALRNQEENTTPREYRNHQSGIQEALLDDDLRTLHEGEIDARIVEVIDINGNGLENILFATNVGGVHSNEFELWEFDGSDYYPLNMEYPSGDVDTARLNEGNSVFFSMSFELIPERQLLIQYQEEVENGMTCTAYPYVWNTDDQLFRISDSSEYNDFLKEGCMLE